MVEIRTGLLVPVKDNVQEDLQALLGDEEEKKYPGFKALRTPQGDVYYVPSGEVVPEGVTGTSLQQDEIPIPYVSLPDVPKEDPVSQPASRGTEIPKEVQPTVYDVTPPEAVPETPAEQLEKLLPPATEAVPETPPEPPPPETKPEPEEPSAAEKALETITKGFFAARKATEPVRQAVAKPLAGLAAIPWMLPAGFEAIRGLQHHDEAERKLSVANAEWLQEQGLGAYKGVHKVLGAEVQPETGVEHVAGQLTSSYVPGSKVATGAMFGVNELMRYLKGDPATMTPEEKATNEARMRVPKALAELLLTPAEAGEAEDRAAAIERLKQGQGARPIAPTTPPAAAPKGKKKGPTITPVSPEDLQEQPVAPGKVPMPAPPIGAVTPDSILRRPHAPKPPGKKKDELPDAYTKRLQEYDKKMKEYVKLDEEWRKQFNPSATFTMNTVGGMKEAKASDLWGMGIMAIGTAGMIATPYVYRAFRQALVPKPLTAEEAAARARPVPGAAPGTITNTGILDALRGATLDINLTTVKLAEKAMMHPAAVDTLEQMLRSGGHTQGQALIDSGIRNGWMRTNTMEFKTPNSLEDINRAIVATDQQMGNKNGTRYLIVRDILEQITLAEAQAKNAGNQATQELGKIFQKIGKRTDVQVFSPKVGPDAEIKINGLTKDDALNIQSTLEKMNPDLKQLGTMWDRWNIDKRKFQADGEAATLTKKKRRI